MFNFGKTEEESSRLVAMDENFAIISFKPDGTIIHANDNFLNVLGYKLSETVGKHHRMFCDKTYTNSPAYTQFWDNLNKGISQVNEFERFKKDGTSVWIQASYTTVKDKNGKVTRVVKFAQDITEAKEVITSAKKAIDLAKIGNFKQTIKESTTNEGIEELKNGINELFQIVSDKVDGDLNKISEALKAFQKLNFTHRITGDIGEVSLGLNNLADIINSMLVENKTNGLTLDESSNILLTNVDKLNVSSNEAAAALEETAAALEEITSNIRNNTGNIQKMAYRENVKKYANIVKSYYDTNKRVDLGDFEIKTKDNRTLIWHCTLAPFGLINGKKVFISTALDITELTEKNKLLIQQSKMATMGEMIGNIAHQWKQPLSLIRASNGLIKLNREYGNFEDQIDKALVDIDSSVENLSSTIDDFRNFFDPNKSVNNFDIKDTFEKTFKLIKSQFSNNDIKIISNINNITVLGLENELLQVLINIIKNAKEQLLEINKDSEKLLFVDTSCDKNNLLILIKDNAQGVPLEIIDKIFDSYFTTKAIDGGTGIGLSMSKQIIESNMHGSLKVFNEEYKYQDKEYKGAVFKIKIPLLYLNGKVKI